MSAKQSVFIDNNPPQCDAAFLNSVKSEINNTISSTGITLNDSILTQLQSAVANYVANADFYTDSGVADAYVLTPITTGSGTNSAPSSYRNGMLVRYRPANANTGSSTVNVASLGVVNIKKSDGTTDTTVGDILADEELTLSYDGSVFRIVLETPSAPYTNIEYKTTSGSWGVPAGVTKVRFVVYGGGGGGGYVTTASGTASTAGGQSKVTFSAVDYAIANGGGAGANVVVSAGSGQNGAAHGTATTGDYNITGGGSAGGAGGLNGAGDGMTAGQGGNGGLSVVDRTVSPSDSWTITVGAAGTGGTGDTANGADGAAGYVIIYY